MIRKEKKRERKEKRKKRKKKGRKKEKMKEALMLYCIFIFSRLRTIYFFTQTLKCLR